MFFDRKMTVLIVSGVHLPVAKFRVEAVIVILPDHRENPMPW